jgi:dTDP-4-dehydrorhamnose 3,5-epimerase
LDERGSVQEWFVSENFNSYLNGNFNIEQINITKSLKNSLRGIHYSLASQGQVKVITCISGAILDVIVDIRLNSPTFGKHIKIELNSSDNNSIFISKGLGHAFLSLTDFSTVAYLMSSKFDASSEYSINPFDEKLGIDWPVEKNKLKLSNRDLGAPTLTQRILENRLPEFGE